MTSTLTRAAAAFAVAALPLIAGATIATADNGPSDGSHNNYCRDKKKDGGTFGSSAAKDQCTRPDLRPPVTLPSPNPTTTDSRHHDGDHRDGDHHGTYDPGRYKDKDKRHDDKRHDDKRHDDGRHDYPRHEPPKHHRHHDDHFRHHDHHFRHHHKRDHVVPVDPWNEVRTATAAFFSVAAAERAGYARPAAPAPLHSCIAKDPNSNKAPAMGFHWINAKLIDAKVEATKPEALVYEPNKDGKLDLVAVEYVVFKSDWEKAGNLTPPKLNGVEFMLTTAPNRYKIPSFYSLHAWIWKSNPDGINEPFNPRVSCVYAGLIK